MTREQFIEGIHVLWQYKAGYHMIDYSDDYIDGFFNAVTVWLSGAYDKSYSVPDEGWDEKGGFRLVVDAYKEEVDERNRSDRWAQGYQQALLLFQEAKGL